MPLTNYELSCRLGVAEKRLDDAEQRLKGLEALDGNRAADYIEAGERLEDVEQRLKHLDALIGREADWGPVHLRGPSICRQLRCLDVIIEWLLRRVSRDLGEEISETPS